MEHKAKKSQRWRQLLDSGGLQDSWADVLGKEAKMGGWGLTQSFRNKPSRVSESAHFIDRITICLLFFCGCKCFGALIIFSSNLDKLENRYLRKVEWTCPPCPPHGAAPEIAYCTNEPLHLSFHKFHFFKFLFNCSLVETQFFYIFLIKFI